MKTSERIYLSAPQLGGKEAAYIQAALESGWIAPTGPQLKTFEAALCEKVDVEHGDALSSGTAALHLALLLSGVERGDTVMCATNTFVASANAILYLGATPVFIDSELTSWNMDPNYLHDALKAKAEAGIRTKAVIVPHIYGQSADLEPLFLLCEEYGAVLIEDAAEALGSLYRGKPVGGWGRFGIFSFNGNKIITTSGGGMLVSQDAKLIEEARHLATQAKEDFPYYEHREIGYNYRMSNLLAALGLAQLECLDEFIQVRRDHFAHYASQLGNLPGVSFMPEASFGRSNRWLTCLLIDPEKAGTNVNATRQLLEDNNIECRPLWKPMHCQPLYRSNEYFGGNVAEGLFQKGLCLPSGAGLSPRQRDRVVDYFRQSVGRQVT